MTRRLVVGIAATLTFLSLPACASRSYMGIPLAAGQVDPELQQLANRARAGDKHAQLELGIRFEEGRGVERDIKRAVELYRMAASDSGGKVWIYTPSPGGGAGGHVVQVDRTGVRTVGVPEARLRLERLMRTPNEN